MLKKFAHGMAINNALNFEASDEGTKAMWEKDAKSRTKLFDYLACACHYPKYNADKDFFSE